MTDCHPSGPAATRFLSGACHEASRVRLVRPGCLASGLVLVIRRRRVRHHLLFRHDRRAALLVRARHGQRGPGTRAPRLPASGRRPDRVRRRGNPALAEDRALYASLPRNRFT
ncbi:hypothetical protein F01_460239 [Burkholderia cenocepacia]|nr:hypothetical protein F01_460239 [Burkholderia cenocepacia]